MSDLRIPNLIKSLKNNAERIQADGAAKTAANIEVKDVPPELRTERALKVEVVERVDAQKLRVRTPERQIVDLALPPRALADVKVGDVLTVQVNPDVPREVIIQKLDPGYTEIVQKIAESYKIDTVAAERLLKQVSTQQAFENIDQGLETLLKLIPHDSLQEVSLVRFTPINIVKDQEFIQPIYVESETKLPSFTEVDYTKPIQQFVFNDQETLFSNPLFVSSKPSLKPIELNILSPEFEAPFTRPDQIKTIQKADFFNLSEFLKVDLKQVDDDPLQPPSNQLIFNVNAPQLLNGESITIPPLGYLYEVISNYKIDNPFIQKASFSSTEVSLDQIFLSTAPALEGEVVAHLKTGQPVIRPDFKGWPEHVAVSASGVLEMSKDALSSFNLGDRIAFYWPENVQAIPSTVLNQDPPSLSPNVSAKAGIFQPNQFPILDVLSLLNIDLLPDILSNHPALTAVQSIERSMLLPNMARPQNLPPALLFLVAAFRGGDMSQVFSERFIEQTVKLGKVERLTQEALKNTTQRTRPEQGSTLTAEWRSILLPLYSEGAVQAMALHWLHDQESKDRQEEDDDKSTRFILDFHLKQMGDLQLDGFYKDRNLQIALKMEALPSSEMQSTLRTYYLDALDSSDLQGDLKFQDISKHGVHFRAENE